MINGRARIRLVGLRLNVDIISFTAAMFPVIVRHGLSADCVVPELGGPLGEVMRRGLGSPGLMMESGEVSQWGDVDNQAASFPPPWIVVVRYDPPAVACFETLGSIPEELMGGDLYVLGCTHNPTYSIVTETFREDR